MEIREATMKDILKERAEGMGRPYTEGVKPEEQISSYTQCTGDKEGDSAFTNLVTENVTDERVAVGGYDSSLQYANDKCVINDQIKPIFSDVVLGFVTDEDSYNAIIPKSYTEQYPYDSSLDTSFPWLVVCFNRDNGPESTFDLTITKDGEPITFNEATCAKLGTIKGNTQTLSAEEYVMYECATDLNESTADGLWRIVITCGTEVIVKEFDLTTGG